MPWDPRGPGETEIFSGLLRIGQALPEDLQSDFIDQAIDDAGHAAMAFMLNLGRQLCDALRDIELGHSD
jgi:hypothetical protein